MLFLLEGIHCLLFYLFVCCFDWMGELGQGLFGLISPCCHVRMNCSGVWNVHAGRIHYFLLFLFVIVLIGGESWNGIGHALDREICLARDPGISLL